MSSKMGIVAVGLWTNIPEIEPVPFAEKTWLKVLFADLLREKNTISAEKNKLKNTDYKTSE
jgi:hypothetical protein